MTQMNIEMFLEGNAYFHGRAAERKPVVLANPLVLEHVYELGYWYNYWDLHGYIYENAAKGREDRERLTLDIEHMYDIIDAIKEKRFRSTIGPVAEGIDEKVREAQTIAIFENAIRWTTTEDGETWRSVIYSVVY